MLLFKPEHVQPIFNDIKIATRRDWKKCRVIVGSTHLAKTMMLSKKFFARLEIKEAFRQPLGDMTEHDAWEEGGYTLEEYQRVWERINQVVWDTKFEPWVVKFKRVQS